MSEFNIYVVCFNFLQQARAEQEEEFISNTLLKKIQLLKKEKESLAMNYEQEEEFLTNDLSRKLLQVCIQVLENFFKDSDYQLIFCTKCTLTYQ